MHCMGHAQRGGAIGSVLLMILLPALCLLAGYIGLISGTAVMISGQRIAPRITEEAQETRGIVTVPVTRVVQPGRVDITVQRKILSVIPWETHILEDVIEADVSSSKNDVRDSRGRITSSNTSATLQLKTRAGQDWRSASASGLLGTTPQEAAAAIEKFIEIDSEPAVSMWWMPWLENVVGIPFALLGLLLVWGCLKMLIPGHAAPREAIR